MPSSPCPFLSCSHDFYLVIGLKQVNWLSYRLLCRGTKGVVLQYGKCKISQKIDSMICSALSRKICRTTSMITRCLHKFRKTGLLRNCCQVLICPVDKTSRTLNCHPYRFMVVACRTDSDP
ncbi:unnamed protein product [Phytomonas sp. EM1]|nr:unnamed protein product [Phytomonas sp. EM1]|eukprot:CCW59964.1 unnamed protein product [Phytomonas sp. isolate EM1]